MKLSAVISVHNQLPLAKACYQETHTNAPDTEFIIIDNESTPALTQEDFLGAKIVRNEKNIGVYPTFRQGFEVATGDVVAFFHSDVVVWYQGWDLEVVKYFESIYPNSLGLVGFVGSNEIDSLGGRGCGTMSNFQGKSLTDGNKTWKGSRAEDHGRRVLGYHRGAVVDGCVMIIKRDAWNSIGYRDDFPPHHFYDRLISTQMLEKGFHVGILGIPFDHISGQTVNQEKGYQEMGQAWLDKNPDPLIVPAHINPSDVTVDMAIYLKAEQKWLKEYRDTKHIVPIRI